MFQSQIISEVQSKYSKEVSTAQLIGRGRAGFVYLLAFNDQTRICLKIDSDPERVLREQQIAELLYGSDDSKRITANAFMLIRKVPVNQIS